MPRGVAALGYAQYLPKEQFLYNVEQMTDEMCMTLGGRAAEELVFGKISTGALSDLERITKTAQSMVAIYGMNAKLGNVSYYDSKGQNEYGFSKPYSEATAQLIDEEIRHHHRAGLHPHQGAAHERRHELEVVAKELLEKEVLLQDDLERLVGKRPFDSQTNLPGPHGTAPTAAKPPAKSKASRPPAACCPTCPS